MAHSQRIVQSCAVSYGSSTEADMAVPDQFPAGLRVLVVDDDTACLRILEQMLRRCLYKVTACSQATVALNILRQEKGCFDVVLSDVHMPDMDGYKLLEYIGLEMDLPVIMMSADGQVSAVMRGIRSGVCDYLIKPIREEELKNIWQHVFRKKWNENKELGHSGSFKDTDHHKRTSDEVEYASSVNEGPEAVLKTQKKRICAKEEDIGELDNDDPSTTKKPRIVWSVELHQQFVSAVNQLGFDKAVPKRILELMNVPGLTRENVASHLQKFRLYLKRLSGVQGGISNAFCAPVETNVKLGSLGRFDIQALAPLAKFLHKHWQPCKLNFLVVPTGNLVSAMEPPALLQSSLQGPKCIPAENGYGVWAPNCLGGVAPSSNLGGLNAPNGDMLMDVLHQQQKQHLQPHQQSMLSEPSRSINVQPSCLVVPSCSSASFPAGNSPASVNQSGSFNRSAVIDYSLLSSQSNNSSLYMGQISDADIKTTGELLDQGTLGNLGFIGKGTHIPSRLAEQFESPMNNLNHGKMYLDTNASRVKEEPNLESVDNTKVGIPMLQQYTPNDLMSVFTD